MNHLPPLVFVFSMLLAPQLVADDVAVITPLKDGDRAPRSAVAHFVSGPLATPNPRSTCPVLKNRKHPKIAIYTREVTPGVVKLVKAIDQIIAVRPEWKWSFLFVTHENDPRPSGDEFTAELARLKKIANTEQISHLSIGLLERAPESGEVVLRKQRLGFLKNGQTAIALIYRLSDPRKRSFVMTGVQYASSDKLTPESVRQIITQLKASLANANGEIQNGE